MFDNFRRQPSEQENDAETPATDPAYNVQESSWGLSWDTRVQCFAGCFILSCVSSLCASALLVIGRFTGFCVLTSVGSLLSLGGTCFLSGPIKQCKSMFAANRWVASLAYIGFILAALISGMVLNNAPLAIIFTVLQYLAMAYYSLTYIPFARRWIDHVLCSCLG
ncbi:unnamed protein product, partial [Mesorhabditis belari]|uniref:Vesicle transport protein n=1 Tax=Mesorhabditis belari TaxID=2138241 RepID=A0AAF3F5N1_9BILA